MNHYIYRLFLTETTECAHCKAVKKCTHYYHRSNPDFNNPIVTVKICADCAKMCKG